jgi:hypothetical protein
MEPAFVEAATELRNKFVLVAPDTFLAEYLPQYPRDMPSIDHETFMNVAFNRSTEEATANEQAWIEKTEEKDMYEPVHLLLISECIYLCSSTDNQPFLETGWKIPRRDSDSAFFMDHQ